MNQKFIQVWSFPPKVNLHLFSTHEFEAFIIFTSLHIYNAEVHRSHILKKHQFTSLVPSFRSTYTIMHIWENNTHLSHWCHFSGLILQSCYTRNGNYFCMCIRSPQVKTLLPNEKKTRLSTIVCAARTNFTATSSRTQRKQTTNVALQARTLHKIKRVANSASRRFKYTKVKRTANTPCSAHPIASIAENRSPQWAYCYS